MTLVCIERPNRTTPRKFTTRDLERIAENIKGQGIPVFKILAVVAIATGLGVLICKAVKMIRALEGIGNLLKEIAIVLSAGLAIKVIIEFLKRSPILKIPFINRFVIIIIVVLSLLAKVLDRFALFAEALLDIDAVTAQMDRICDAIVEAARDSVARGKDVSEDLLELL